MKRKLLYLSLVTLILTLVACGGYEEPSGNANNPSSPPPGAFSMQVNPTKLELARGNDAGTVITVELGFDSNYEHEVLLRTNEATKGISVLYGGAELNSLDLRIKTPQSIDLTVTASQDAQTLNPYLEVIAQGINAKGSTRGLARLQSTLDVTIR